MSSMDQAGLDSFQAVRFLADVPDLVDPDMPPTEQADRLLSARMSIPIGALGFRVVFVFPQDVTIGLDPRRAPVPL